jgi:multicomponent Na+:H+ antiporter subunit G
MEILLQTVAWALILTGSAAVLIGGIGVLRFPDIYTRMHAASITDTAGAGLILAGLMVHEGATLVTVKLILMLVFLFFTSPTSSFSLAHAALTSGVEPVLHKPDDGDDAEKG